MLTLVVRIDNYFVTKIAINCKKSEMNSSNEPKGDQLLTKREDNCKRNECESMGRVMNLTVCLLNDSGVCLSIEDKFQSLTASEVLHKVCRELSHQNINGDKPLSFGTNYKKLFSIWVTSTYLELQLQPTHRPFNVLANWNSLLRKHGPIELIQSSNPELIDRDEPTLSLQRNVFCDKRLEFDIDISDVGALRLLYFEAKLNVLDGRYPFEDFEKLAAIQAAIDLGPYDPNLHSVEYFRQHLNEYIPCNYIKASDGNKINGLIRTLSRGSQTLRSAQRIVKEYKEFKDISKDRNIEYKLLKKYLELCWTIPCYGSAYFSAQIERPIKSTFASLMSHFDLKVWVAINREGIHVISKERPELLLSIDYNDLCWAVGSPQNSSDPNCIPCLFVQISDESDENNNILQIFSRQYRLIESLLNSFIEDMKKCLDSNASNNLSSCDCTDGPLTAETVSSSVTTSGFTFSPSTQKSRIEYNPKKLSIAKFDALGHCINKTGSWVRKSKSIKT